ncbi:MAG: class I mannose-6-phosphate isomerase [Pirellula sp.]|jgi:mannose-6-phosphate isomerase|nr:class I mannose-6-phosphate isomerase [Pirellula sp.]
MFDPNHPLRFEPIYRSYLWGGQRLKARLGKNLPNDGVWAESWEIVDHREGESRICEGPTQGRTLRQLLEQHSHAIVGHGLSSERFPLLLKYLDCQRVLSVQVHPDDVYGARMAIPDRGKTEAWYIVESEPGAVLYAGLKPGIGRQELQEAIKQGATESCLHTLHPQAGDCVFIPAGTVHALGAGLIVAEIQQASDCTFRLFDWNRVDADGKARPLHINQALEVIDFERGPISVAKRHAMDWPGMSLLVDCDKFRLLECVGLGSYSMPSDTFAIVTLPQGSGQLVTPAGSYPLARGDSLLIPAACQDAQLHLDSNSIALIATPAAMKEFE